MSLISFVRKIQYLYIVNRQMKGEDFQGLNMDDLLKLEKALETGLKRVIETKVHMLRSFD